MVWMWPITLDVFYANMGVGEENNHVWEPSNMNCVRPVYEFMFTFLEIREVERFITEIDVNKASGIEGINASILKECLLTRKLELTYLYNLSLYTGFFPDSWKESVITPIPKEGNRLSAGN